MKPQNLPGATQTVHAWVNAQAQQAPQAPYLIDSESGAVLRFGDLPHRCEQVGHFLRVAGAQPGDTVSIVMANGAGTVQLLLGALYGGWCVNPVNLLSSAEQMRYVLSHSDCKVVLVSAA